MHNGCSHVRIFSLYYYLQKPKRLSQIPYILRYVVSICFSIFRHISAFFNKIKMSSSNFTPSTFFSFPFSIKPYVGSILQKGNYILHVFLFFSFFFLKSESTFCTLFVTCNVSRNNSCKFNITPRIKLKENVTYIP